MTWRKNASVEVRVVVQVRARGDDPVDEAALDQWNERRHSESRRRERAGERHSDRDVGLEHLLDEQPACLAQSRRIVGEKRVVDQISSRLAPVDRAGFDAIAAEKPALLVRGVFGTGALALLGGAFLRGFGTGSGDLAGAVVGGAG
jgi:hypothetical protein